MKPTRETAVFVVVLTEHERGWGSKEFHREYFNDLDKARAYCDKENAKNTSVEVPDWYIKAWEPAINPDRTQPIPAPMRKPAPSKKGTR